MVQFVDGCIYRCSGHRKLPHLDVPATLKYFHLLHCPNSYVELFILALQKGRPPDKLDNTNARSQTRVSSVGDTHQGKLLHILHGSTFLISSTRWLSCCFSPPFHIPHMGTCLPLGTAHNNTKLTSPKVQTHRPLLLSHTMVPPTNSRQFGISG